MKKFLVNLVIRFLTGILLKIDGSALKHFPKGGPLLVAVNHVNFLDAPVVLTRLYPRPTTGLIKKETWDDPLLAFLLDVWDGIPIDRDGADFTAFRLAKQALRENKILAFAPEGTRTENGRLIQAKPGVGILLNQCDVPILPVVYWGHEHFSENFKRLKRTPMHIQLGKPFMINWDGRPRNKETMQAVADAIMMEIASLLPEEYRGVYSQGAFEHDEYIKYVELPTGEHIPEAFGKQFSQP